jgi:peptidoglycan/LPS O-acetylase OafA/YrhL
MSRIPELDGLRAWAILAVFCVHFGPSGYPISDAMALGWSGVDLFFAVSGFLITGILLSLRTHDSPYKTFYWRRALRIFPPYYLALVLIQLLTVLHGEKQTRNEQIAAWFLLSSLGHGFSLSVMCSHLLHGGFRVLAKPLFHHSFREFHYGKAVFWSLSVEELFYLLWAPVILKGSRRLILGFCLVPLVLCPVLRALNHTAEFLELFSFPCRFDALAAGGCVALLFAAVREGRLAQRYLDHGLRLALVLTSAPLILLIRRCGALRGVEIRSTVSFSVLGYSLLALFCAAIVGSCARWSGTSWTRFLRFQPFLKLGTISYMAYLIHIPTFTAAGLLLSKFGAGTWRPLLQGGIALAATIGIAALSWKYFESPILALKDRRFGSSAPAAIGAYGTPVATPLMVREQS